MNNKLDDIFEEMEKMVEQPLPTSVQLDLFYYQVAMQALLASLLLAKGLITKDELSYVLTEKNIKELARSFKNNIAPETAQNRF